MELLFPKIYNTIDFSKKVEFLDTAMRPIAAFAITAIGPLMFW